MVGVFLVSLALRFWGLSRFNTLVFDEVYFAKFANNYLTHKPFFDGHPPLSKYIIAIGIWIGSHAPWVANAPKNALTGSLLAPWSYRWVDALTGSLIPLVVAAIAYQLSRCRSYALIAGVFAAADGLFLVESRYALNNVYLVIFGLLGQLCFLLALNQPGQRRRLWLVLAGIGFGASASVKWNGLGFLLGIYLIWAVAWILQLAQSFQLRVKHPAKLATTPSPHLTSDLSGTKLSHLRDTRTPLQNLTQINVVSLLVYLGAIPVIFYGLIWIPHLQLNPSLNFWQLQQKLLEYHESVGGNLPKVHPYCSPWYTWLLMIRPIAYFYQTARNLTDPLALAGPPLPANAVKVVYDVHAIGNPVLWWLSTTAMVLFIGLLLWMLVQRIQAGVTSIQAAIPQQQKSWVQTTGGVGLQSIPTWVALYLVLNYAANLLPWVDVNRCTFLYHYMGASVFAALAIAWIVNYWLHSTQRRLRAIGVTIIFLVLLAFVFWMPIYLGLPLSPESLRLRMWLRSWV